MLEGWWLWCCNGSWWLLCWMIDVNSWGFFCVFVVKVLICSVWGCFGWVVGVCWVCVGKRWWCLLMLVLSGISGWSRGGRWICWRWCWWGWWMFCSVVCWRFGICLCLLGWFCWKLFRWWCVKVLVQGFVGCWIVWCCSWLVFRNWILILWCGMIVFVVWWVLILLFFWKKIVIVFIFIWFMRSGVVGLKIVMCCWFLFFIFVLWWLSIVVIWCGKINWCVFLLFCWSLKCCGISVMRCVVWKIRLNILIICSLGDLVCSRCIGIWCCVMVCVCWFICWWMRWVSRCWCGWININYRELDGW